MKIRILIGSLIVLIMAVSGTAISIAISKDGYDKVNKDHARCLPGGSIDCQRKEPNSAGGVSSATGPSPSLEEVYPSSDNTGAKGALTKIGPGDLMTGHGWKFDAAIGLIAEDGAVVENLDIQGGVQVLGNNVTIRNSRITLGGETMGISIRHAKNTLVEDTTVRSDGKDRLMVGVKDVYGDASGTVLRRVDVSGASTAIQMDEGILEDSYIHDLEMRDGDHVNGVTSNGGSSPFIIRHNTILNSFSQTDAISLFQDFGIQENRLIEDNLIAGGGYSIYGGEGVKGKSSNIKILNNRFSTKYFPESGYWGPVAYFAAKDPGNEWYGNIWADGPLAAQAIGS